MRVGTGTLDRLDVVRAGIAVFRGAAAAAIAAAPVRSSWGYFPARCSAGKAAAAAPAAPVAVAACAGHSAAGGVDAAADYRAVIGGRRGVDVGLSLL